MVITFDSGFSNVGTEILKNKKKRDAAQGQTVWEQYLAKRAEKKNAKKQARKDKHKAAEEGAGGAGACRNPFCGAPASVATRQRDRGNAASCLSQPGVGVKSGAGGEDLGFDDPFFSTGGTGGGGDGVAGGSQLRDKKGKKGKKRGRDEEDEPADARSQVRAFVCVFEGPGGAPALRSASNPCSDRTQLL